MGGLISNKNQWRTISCCVTKEDFLDDKELIPEVRAINKPSKVGYIEDETKPFEFTYQSVIDYLESHLLAEFELSEEEITEAENLSERMMVVKRIEKSFLIKTLIFQEELVNGIESRHVLASYEQYLNQNIFKEARISITHIGKFNFMAKCLGYWVVQDTNEIASESDYIQSNANEEKVNIVMDHDICTNSKTIKTTQIFLVYDYYDHTLEGLISKWNLDIPNKMKIFRNLLMTVLAIHSSGLISLDLNSSSFRFSSDYQFKLTKYENTIDMNSEFDIDRSSVINRKTADHHTPPEIQTHRINLVNWQTDIWSLGVIIAKLFSSKLIKFESNKALIACYSKGIIPEELYKNIEIVFVKAIVVGILRIDPSERPNIFEICDVYNELVQNMKYSDEYKICYTKEDVLDFTKVFAKSTDILIREYKENGEFDHTVTVKIQGNMNMTGENNPGTNTNGTLLINSIA